MEVARYLAGGPDSDDAAADDEVIAQAQALGAPPEVLARLRAQAAQRAGADAAPMVWPENAKAVAVFVAMQTQWLVSGSMAPVRTGLNYASLPVVAQARGCTVEAVFDDVRTMEVAALGVWSRQRQGGRT